MTIPDETVNVQRPAWSCSQLEDLVVELVGRALTRAPNHRPVLELVDRHGVPDHVLPVFDALVAVGSKATPVRWRGPGALDMAGGPCGTHVVSAELQRRGHDLAALRSLVLRPLLTDAAGVVLPVEIIAEQVRARTVEQNLRRVLVSAASSLTAGADPVTTAARLRDALEAVA